MPANHNYFSGKRFTCYGWGKSFDRIELAGRRELAGDQSVEKNGGKKTVTMPTLASPTLLTLFG